MHAGDSYDRVVTCRANLSGRIRIPTRERIMGREDATGTICQCPQGMSVYYVEQWLIYRFADETLASLRHCLGS